MRASLVRAGAGEETALLTAVSGGADSTSLLAALDALRPAMRFALYALHVDHGLRGEAGHEDARAVSGLCARLGVPCRLVTLPEGYCAKQAREGRLGLEAAARQARRTAWEAEAARLGARFVLTAHTRDDALETLLMRVLRGAGPAGLAGMEERRGLLLRPLLGVGRGEVRSYLAARHLGWREDASNADCRFLRNRVRLRLVPLLDAEFPGWRRALLSLAATQRRTADFLRSELTRRAGQRWESLPPILREEAVFAAWDRLAGEGSGAGEGNGEREFEPDAPPRRSGPPRRQAVRRFAEGGLERADLGRARIERAGDALRALPAGEGLPREGFALLITEPGVYEAGGIVLTCTEAGEARQPGHFYADLPLLLRPARRGDTLAAESGPFTPARPGGLLCAQDTRGPAAFITPARPTAITPAQPTAITPAQPTAAPAVRARKNAGFPAKAAFRAGTP